MNTHTFSMLSLASALKHSLDHDLHGCTCLISMALPRAERIPSRRTVPPSDSAKRQAPPSAAAVTTLPTPLATFLANMPPRACWRSTPISVRLGQDSSCRCMTMKKLSTVIIGPCSCEGSSMSGGGAQCWRRWEGLDVHLGT